MPQTVLVVDDEPRIAAIAADYLRHAGYSVLTASDGTEALALARAKRPDDRRLRVAPAPLFCLIPLNGGTTSVRFCRYLWRGRGATSRLRRRRTGEAASQTFRSTGSC